MNILVSTSGATHTSGDPEVTVDAIAIPMYYSAISSAHGDQATISLLNSSPLLKEVPTSGSNQALFRKTIMFIS